MKSTAPVVQRSERAAHNGYAAGSNPAGGTKTALYFTARVDYGRPATLERLMRGYTAIGLLRPKVKENIGSTLRAAFCYGSAMIAIEGDRTDIRSCTDTYKAYRHIPVLRGNLQELIPFDCVPVAVDLVEGAIDLPSYQHPQRAFYIFGPEDSTLDKDVLSWCRDRVSVPTRGCMNLAATVNVVLYDRMAKASQQERIIKNDQVRVVV